MSGRELKIKYGHVVHYSMHARNVSLYQEKIESSPLMEVVRIAEDHGVSLKHLLQRGQVEFLKTRRMDLLQKEKEAKASTVSNKENIKENKQLKKTDINKRKVLENKGNYWKDNERNLRIEDKNLTLKKSNAADKGKGMVGQKRGLADNGKGTVVKKAGFAEKEENINMKKKGIVKKGKGKVVKKKALAEKLKGVTGGAKGAVVKRKAVAEKGNNIGVKNKGVVKKEKAVKKKVLADNKKVVAGKGKGVAVKKRVVAGKGKKKGVKKIIVAGKGKGVAVKRRGIADKGEKGGIKKVIVADRGGKVVADRGKVVADRGEVVDKEQGRATTKRDAEDKDKDVAVTKRAMMDKGKDIYGTVVKQKHLETEDLKRNGIIVKLNDTILKRNDMASKEMKIATKQMGISDNRAEWTKKDKLNDVMDMSGKRMTVSMKGAYEGKDKCVSGFGWDAAREGVKVLLTEKDMTVKLMDVEENDVDATGEEMGMVEKESIKRKDVTGNRMAVAARKKYMSVKGMFPRMQTNKFINFLITSDIHVPEDVSRRLADQYCNDDDTIDFSDIITSIPSTVDYLEEEKTLVVVKKKHKRTGKKLKKKKLFVN